MEITKKKGKKVNGRNKGAAFERKVARMLTAWWGVMFHRVPQSGGLHWDKDNRVTGDIMVPDGEDGKDFPFTVECKNQEGWIMDNILRDTGDVKNWWKQAYGDNQRLDDKKKTPLLIFTRNFAPEFYMVFYDKWRRLPLPEQNYFITTLKVEEESHKVAIGLFEDLLNLKKEIVVKNLSA